MPRSRLRCQVAILAAAFDRAFRRREEGGEAMSVHDTILAEARKALRSEPRVRHHGHPIAVRFADGELTIEGEVENVAAKKLALKRVAAVPGVSSIVDRLHVVPAERMGDNAIRQAVLRSYLAEAELAALALQEVRKGRTESVRFSPIDTAGVIVVAVADGVVTLNGRVHGLAEKRLAEVLAWWVPGSRDVVNDIVVDPPEEDSDDAIAEAVRLVLEMDPFVNADQIRIGVRRAVVTLEGLVPKSAERDMAEYDAWYVFGVEGVVNEVEVRA
jgi:osmotically-inducible protein OsmY